MPNLGVMQRTVDQYQKDLGGYQKEVRQFNFDADVYNKQLKEYQALVDAYKNNPAVVDYNNAIKNYNEVLLPQYNASLPAYNQKAAEYTAAADAYNKKVNFWSSGNITSEPVLYIGRVSGSPQSVIDKLRQAAAYGNDPARREIERITNTYNPGSFNMTRPTAPTAPSQPTEPNVQKPGDFTAVKPELTATAPKDPGFTNQQMQLLSGKQTVAQQERNRDSGLVSGAQEALKQSRDEGSMIGGLLARARYST